MKIEKEDSFYNIALDADIRLNVLQNEKENKAVIVFFEDD